jgi:MoaA/NifB/PqqE/SkfB family radical SAM enzyme
MDAYALKREWSSLEEKFAYYFSRSVNYPLVPPEHVYFSLTNRCNLRCEMCDISRVSSRKEDELTTEEVKKIILQIKDLGVRHLIFSGGEPLLRDDLLEVIGYAISSGIKMVDIITNGTLLNEEAVGKLGRAGLNHITVSLDGLKEVNNSIRGEGSFEKSERGIDFLNSYKRNTGASNPTLGINFTIMDKNVGEMLKMVEFARGKNCNIIVYQPLLFNNTKMYEKKTNLLWPSRANIGKLKKIIKEVSGLKDSLSDIFIYTDKAVLEAIPGYFLGKKAGKVFKCYEGIKRVVITCDGKLWSCLGMYGDLKTDNLKNIWFSKAAFDVRSKAKKCREHCLQDCVFFPSNVFEQMNSLIKRLDNLPGEQSKEIKSGMLSCVDEYRGVVKKYLRLAGFDLPRLKQLAEESYKLGQARKKLKK